MTNRAGERSDGAPLLRSRRGSLEGLAYPSRSRLSSDEAGSVTGTLRTRLFQWRRKLATAGVILIAAYLALHVVFGSNGWIMYQKKRAEHRQLQAEIEKLQSQNQAIEQRVKALRSDPEAIKKEAREQLHLAKPGEVIYVMPAQKAPEVKPPANATAEKK
ncbi:MAG: septum formation initiator family protein [Terriglobales bacterium]